MATKTKILSWGKCTAKVTPLAGSGYIPNGGDVESVVPIEFNAIVQNSTNLETAQGDKTEARIEGGGIEAAIYGENTYTLTFQVRIGSDDAIQLKNHNGVVDGEFKVEILPANKTAKKVSLARASANVQTGYSSADGIVATYTFTSLEVEGQEQISVELQS